MNDQRKPPEQPKQARPPQAPPPAAGPPGKLPNETIFEWAQRSIAGTFATVEEAAARLRLAANFCHLVGGASVCPLRIGHEIAITVLEIDPNTLYPQKAREGDPVKMGIGGSTIMQIGAAAGVEWTEIKRLDDRRDVHVAVFRATGRYPSIDGNYRKIGPDEADSDFRDRSPSLHNKSEKEIPFLRANIVRSTMTKAQLRALRKAFGIPHSMTQDELAKPYVFSRMIWTGRDSNPEVQKMFAKVEATKQLMSHAALYGMSLADLGLGTPQIGPSEASPPPQLKAAAEQASAEILKAVDAEEMPNGGDDGDDAPRPMAPIPTSSGGAAPDQRGGGGRRPLTIGKDKTPVRDASDKDLEYWEERISRELKDGTCKPQYREANQDKLEAIREEMGIRANKGDVTGREPPPRPRPQSYGDAPAPAPAPAQQRAMSDAERAAAIDRGEDGGREIDRGDDPNNY